MPKLPIALQMYTLREDTDQDFAGTIRKVADIGYAAVELAGYGGLSVQEVAGLLADNHLKVAGSHISLDTIEADVSKVIEENLALSNTHIVVPYLGDDRRGTAADYEAVAASLNKYGETLRASGMTLCYHNHDFEFKPLEDGRLGEDIILDGTDPIFVKAEVDSYWIMKAGHDPVAFIRKHSGRVPLLHLKDMDPEDKSFAPIGTGLLPLDELIAAAGEIGTEYLIVEQDVCKGPALEAVTLSYNNLKAKGYA